MNIPKIGKKYNCFDDGKIRESRLYVVEIEDVIPFGFIDKKTLNLWKKEVKTCYWLYDKKTDYFIKARTEDEEEQVFVRTIDDGWFSLGFLSAGELDIDGKLTNIMNNNKQEE